MNTWASVVTKDVHRIVTLRGKYRVIFTAYEANFCVEFRVFLPCTSIYVFFPLEVFEISLGGGRGGLCCRVTVLQMCRVQFRVKMDPLHATYTPQTEHRRESVCSSVHSTIPVCLWRNSRTDRTNFHETLHRRAELMCSFSIQSIGLKHVFLLGNLELSCPNIIAKCFWDRGYRCK